MTMTKTTPILSQPAFAAATQYAKLRRGITSTVLSTMLTALLAFASPSTMATTSAHGKPLHATPIKFPQGAISTVVDGILPSKKQETWYQFAAQKGQYAIVNISGKPGIKEVANVGVLSFPSGAQDGTKGGVVYQGCLPETGTYHLRIARNLMATNGGMAGYRAEVIILPPAASEALCS